VRGEVLLLSLDPKKKEKKKEDKGKSKLSRQLKKVLRASDSNSNSSTSKATFDIMMCTQQTCVTKPQVQKPCDTHSTATSMSRDK